VLGTQESDWIRRWRREGSVIGFKNDALMVQSGAPFIEYDVTGFKKFLCWSVDKAERTALLGKTKEGAGHRVSREFAPRMGWHMDMGHTAKNLEL